MASTSAPSGRHKDILREQVVMSCDITSLLPKNRSSALKNIVCSVLVILLAHTHSDTNCTHGHHSPAELMNIIIIVVGSQGKI